MINGWILSIIIVVGVVFLIGMLVLSKEDNKLGDIAMGIIVFIALVALTLGVHHIIELVRLARGA